MPGDCTTNLPLAFPFLVLGALSAGGCSDTADAVESAAPAETEWLTLFNGEDLTGWTPKIAGTEAGEDPLGTFRVEDGLLTVGYEGYGEFERRFGHLFYEVPFSHYQLRVEYRFIGEQVSGGPDWAFRNSGIMFHSQPPQSMLVDQDFPISVEAQFLGIAELAEGEVPEVRATGSICTPGTHIVQDSVLIERHCIVARAPTIAGEEWVVFDLIVRGDEFVAHVVNGDTVMTYAKPQIGGGAVANFDPEAKDDGKALVEGYIALQSESHPIQFRKVLLKVLDSGPSG